MIDATVGRIVNVGSGAGPMFTGKQSAEDNKAMWMNPEWTWDQLHAKLQELLPTIEPFPAYALSKGAVSTYTMMCAHQHPHLKINSITPGLVDTAIVAGMDQFGAKITPEEGTKSIRHCLFADLKGNGWYYGSDALRSPWDRARKAGDPEWDGN